jgi:hypothetical protein
VRGLIGSSWSAVFGCVHIEEARNHLVMIERGQQKRGGFPRAHHKFSRAVGHSEVSSCTRLRFAPQQETQVVR